MPKHKLQGMKLAMLIAGCCILWQLTGCSSHCHLPEISLTFPVTRVELAQRPPTADETIQVERDAVYEKPKRYRGITLGKYLKSVGIGKYGGGEDAVIQFICSDGYTPSVRVTNALNGNAFLATGDLDAPAGETWLSFRHGEQLVEPGPYYLVWPDSKNDEAHPWPYGVTAIQTGVDSELVAPAKPKAAKFQKGFELFQANCMKCHSINGVGGTLGVELNVPRNVFEYWDASVLPGYIENPNSVRRNSKMPAFASLGRDKIGEILAYIKYMRGQKAAVLNPK